jgi:hypothetical protein
MDYISWTLLHLSWQSPPRTGIVKTLYFFLVGYIHFPGMLQHWAEKKIHRTGNNSSRGTACTRHVDLGETIPPDNHNGQGTIFLKMS